MWMDKLLRLVCVVFVSIGSCTRATDKPPDALSNISQYGNMSDKDSADPSKSQWVSGTNNSEFEIQRENKTVIQGDGSMGISTSARSSNISRPENLFEVINNTSFVNQSIASYNSSVTNESEALAATKLPDYPLEKDWKGITETGVNNTVIRNASVSVNSTFNDTRPQEIEPPPYAVKEDGNKTTLPRYQNESDFANNTDNPYRGVNDSVGDTGIRLHSLFLNRTSEQPRNASDIHFPNLLTNTTSSAANNSHYGSPNSGNASLGDEVVREKPPEISSDYVYNSTAIENVSNLSGPGCVNGSDGPKGGNCSTKNTFSNSSLSDASNASASERTGSAANNSHLLLNIYGSVNSTSGSVPLTFDQRLLNVSDLLPKVIKSNNSSVVRTSNSTGTNVSVATEKITASSTAPPGGSDHHKPYTVPTISPQLKQHYKGVVQTILLEGLKHGTWEAKVPIEDGPFGSLIWRDKKYLISVLVPIGVGITGAVVIVIVAYAVRSYKRKQKRRAFTSPSRTFRPQAQLAIMDQVLLLDDSSDDEF